MRVTSAPQVVAVSSNAGPGMRPGRCTHISCADGMPAVTAPPREVAWTGPLGSGTVRAYSAVADRGHHPSRAPKGRAVPEARRNTAAPEGAVGRRRADALPSGAPGGCDGPSTAVCRCDRALRGRTCARLWAGHASAAGHVRGSWLSTCGQGSPKERAALSIRWSTTRTARGGDSGGGVAARSACPGWCEGRSPLRVGPVGPCP